VILDPNALSFDYLFVAALVEWINSLVLGPGRSIFRLKPLAGLPIRPTIYNMVSAKTTRPQREQGDHQRIRLVLLDDHVLFRESLARLLASEHDFELIAECGTPAEALKSLKNRKADVTLVDAGIARAFFSACGAHYSGKTLVIASEIDAPNSALVLKQGASGIFLASDSPSRLAQAIRLVALGEAWLDQKVIRLLAERFPDYDDRWFGTLGEREQAVLQGIVDGLSNRKIGDQMGVSESKIKAILQSLFSKAGVRTRSQLVRIALQRSRQAVSEVETTSAHGS
jgi:two-component system, NarL family, nitrate/nitrite response regulator NarL